MDRLGGHGSGTVRDPPRAMPEPETAALNLTCAECRRSPRRGETWGVYFADIGEAVTYCPACGEREFGDKGGDDGRESQ
jgi:hypothetical protein